MTTTVLAADVGGTKTLLALHALTEDGLRLQRQRRYASREWPCFEQVLTDFLQRSGGADAALAGACFAVAGPVGQGARPSHQPGLGRGSTAVGPVSGHPRRRGGERRRCAHPWVAPSPARHGGGVAAGTPQPGGTVAVLGLGTGVGMAMGIPTPNGLWRCPSEGGHQEFAPAPHGNGS